MNGIVDINHVSACRNQVPQAEQLQQERFIFSQLGRL